jgi:transposase
MSKRFIKVDYEQTLEQTVTLREVLPEDHLARFVVELIAQLDLSGFYASYGKRGGSTYAPEVLLALLIYSYATGVFSSRKIERATYESIPFRFLAGGLHPDHDTIAHFRKRFLPQITTTFVELLMLAQAAGVLKLGNISLDGSKVHADASKSKAVSYKRLGELEAKLRKEVEELLALAREADETGQGLPRGLVIEDEVAFREQRLAGLAQARTVLEQRARERYEQEQAHYEARLKERQQKTQQTGKKPRGREPKPPVEGPGDKDQYNFTDPDSRIMKNSTDGGFAQHYNTQIAVDQATLLVLGASVLNHPNDQQALAPTLDNIPQALGQIAAVALDNGYFSSDNIALCQQRQIEPYIASGREAHHRSWQAYFAETALLPDEQAGLKEQMAYKLCTALGRAIYRLRKCTVEPVIGIIKETLGFRQFSLRGLVAASGEWLLVCLAFNVKRLHKLTHGRISGLAISPTGC